MTTKDCIKEIKEIIGTPAEFSILDDVLDVLKNRQDQYGNPEDSFADIARIWSVLFKVEITSGQVALAMIAMKIIREQTGHKRDNIIDIIGYAVHLDRLTKQVDTGGNSDELYP